MPETGGLFVIDAETGDTSQFTSVLDDGTCAFIAEAAAKNNGVYGFSATFDGTNENCYGLKTFTDKTGIYVRFYVYIDASFDITAAGYSVVFLAGIYDGFTRLASVQIITNGATNPDRWRFTGQDITSTTSTTNFSRGGWHRVEIRWLADATVGGMQVWVDGDSVFAELDNNTSAYAADSIRIGSDSAGTGIPESGAYIYFDDIKAAETGPIGVYSAGGLSIPVAMAHYARMRGR